MTKGKNTYQRIYAVVRKIPVGKVMTYGQVAARAGLPNGARLAGYAMAASPENVPWQRVVAKSRKGFGRISIHDSFTSDLQRQLLEGEGVELSDKGEIDLTRFGNS